MKKRGLSFIAIKIVIALLVFGAFAIAPIAAQAYPTGKEFYPAVYGMIMELYPNSRCIEIDFYENKYIITGITGSELLIPISYNLNVLLKNGKIELTYDKIYQKDINTGRWDQMRGFGFYNWKKASKAMGDKMVEIAKNQALYDKYERAAMGDIYFVHTVLKNFTSLAFKDFFDNYVKNAAMSVKGKIYEVKEYNKEVNGTLYKYEIRMSTSFAFQGDAFMSVVAADVWCWYYTNDSSVIRLKKDADFTAEGVLVSARQLDSSVSLTLVDTK